MQTALRCKCATKPLSHSSHLQILFHTKRRKESNSYQISTKEEALCISSVNSSLCIHGFGGIISWKICGWYLMGAQWVLPQAAPSLSLARCHPSDFPHLFFSFFPFSFLSRFPDPGLKMKRKSYCLITTAVTSIKCYLKVNGLHMLKTLELLTDHCKVSRIFNNLHVTHNSAIFGAEQTVSLASPCQGSQQKPLLHSSFTWQKQAKGAKHWTPWDSSEHSQNPVFPQDEVEDWDGWRVPCIQGAVKGLWPSSRAQPSAQTWEEEHCSSLKAT